MIRLATMALLLTVSVAMRAQTEGAKWVLVPDSLVEDVRELVSGRRVAVENPDMPADFSEKVIAGGDTTVMYLRERNYGRFDRGLLNHLFIPKGVWQFGLTAAYGSFDATDLQILDLMTDFDFNGHTFSIKPYISYFIKNNLCAGMRLGYTSNRATLGSLSVDFDEDLNFNISDAYYNNESYTAALFFRQYIGLARRGRFGVFNEVELAFSSSHGDFRRNYDGQPKLTETTGMEAKISFSPGLTIFMQKNVCFNVSFGVLGFYLKNYKQRVDNVEQGSRFTSGANFRFNIFNINFGLGIQI